VKYSTQVMDHFFNPRNVGELPNANAVSIAKNPNDGDIVKLFLDIKDNRIVDAKFKTMGCVVAIAASSKLSEMIKGMSTVEARNLSKQSLIDQLGGLPENKILCSLTCIEALLQALMINDIKERNRT